MPTYPLPTLAGQVTSTGYSAPAFEDILNSRIATLQSIYGSDILLEPDDQDYQREAAYCAALNDLNNLGAAVYSSYHPAFAQGVGLSAAVQTNGISREIATNSTVTTQIGGVAGTIIQGGIVRDQNGNLWNLPDLVTIDNTGAVIVTATAQQPGAIAALAGTVTPYTIISGWQTASFTATAVSGAPVESDAALRKRQSQSTALPALTPLQSIMAAVANSGGVLRYQGYQNVGNAPDANGIPAHAIAVVVEGGNATAIATAIQQKKAPGTPSYGTTSVSLVDQGGIPVSINYFVAVETPIYCSVIIHALSGYVSTTGTAAVQAIVDFINGLGIGQEVYIAQIIAAGSLLTSPLGLTFAITSLQLGTAPGVYAGFSVPIAFNAAAQCAVANVVLALG
jgi:uncharacterized phage protein gp47/JayE